MPDAQAIRFPIPEIHTRDNGREWSIDDTHWYPITTPIQLATNPTISLVYRTESHPPWPTWYPGPHKVDCRCKPCSDFRKKLSPVLNEAYGPDHGPYDHRCTDCGNCTYYDCKAHNWCTCGRLTAN